MNEGNVQFNDYFLEEVESSKPERKVAGDSAITEKMVTNILPKISARKLHVICVKDLRNYENLY